MSRVAVSRRSMLTALMTAAPLAALAMPAFAGAEWCDDDPLLTLTTPDGKEVQAYATLSGRSPVFVSHQDQQGYLLPDLRAARISSSSRYVDGNNGRGGKGDHQGQQDCRSVNFTVTVHIPDDARYGAFETRVVVSSGPNGTGTRYAEVHGRSGRKQELRFQIACS